ncbi:SNARE associated Golgi protein, putative [Plasmodium knowlesi strain H]|uniref:SNARE associated Golgi protein, putative n=3 Tax=Plasmodium knowlesi TaxID=5850 RepID=A0A5K1V000_PLAKH|nr:SNARE associated Golgi protein, putative [Plasmodium knowlesi strain H]OTN64537.1 putative SNARE associated Golgi protein [Plasmodium knowlesi]CAA9988885.1 SNARE associated Golgi protein, putative [Plasmodium knowlesi strain H]SBO24724.1 SNARE associated Golgi protein, putative [Plasmodium knowlesi strain H]SBO27994.1 SNARE associated Golgi protein, putative [Plasmodium knowlesi strain H]VVS78359.1 SNARE associated Golgi protein, putative [Plasmodium knowlesi strain H]|eukprot:XP_002261232.1 hypothetical protein, conserved in Plasmodium species [Plasmodium knowlesi strain H]
MDNIENHSGKKYEYLNNNYDTVYNETEVEGDAMSKNYHAGMNYSYSQNLLNKSNGTNMYMNNDMNGNMNGYMNKGAHSATNGMNGNFHYAMNNKKYNSSMEKEKLISNKSMYKKNRSNYNNTNYESNDEDCSETHYHFENKYNSDKDLENNRILIEPDELMASRRNHMRTKMQVLIKVLIIVAIFFLLVFLITKFKKFLDLINVVIKWVGEQGSWSILLFILLFTCTAPLFMSVEIMCVGAGLIFSGVYGKFWGIIVAVFSVATGYVLGMSLCFIISRYLMHEFIYKKLMVYPIYLAFNQAINSNGLSFVLLIRLSPILPASVVSYILGVTSVKYKDFALGSISALPSISIFVYIGVLLQDISNISEMENQWTNLIILFIGFILGVIAIAYISVVTKRRLNNLNIMNSSLSTTNIDIE